MRRQAIALTEHVIPHVNKEDTLITPLVCETFTPPEQGAQIGRMMAGFPPDVMARTMPWMIGHLDDDDRVAYVGMMQKAIQQRDDAGSIGKDFIPLFERSIGRENHRFSFVTPVDDFVE